VPGRRLAVFLLCFGVLLTPGNAAAQDVKSTFDKSVDFHKIQEIYLGIQLSADSAAQGRSGTHQHGDRRFHQPESASQGFCGG
jgi:hypothetical protein